MKLNQLINNAGAKHKAKCLGRGIGSGKGKTAGHGVKGQKARSGVAINGFEGGQNPIIKRLPKRGFKSRKSVLFSTINLVDIDSLILSSKIDHKDVITKELLVSVGLIKNTKSPVKLLAGGGVLNSLTVNLDAYSTTARTLVESAGGKIL